MSRILLAGVSVAALAAGAAQAQTPDTTIFGGGSTLAAKVYRDIFNCYSGNNAGVFGTSPGNPSTASYPAALNSACQNPVNSNVAIGYEPVGSGAGLSAYTTGVPANFGSPSTTNTIAYLNTNVGINSTPYPEIQFAASDAYLNATQAQQASIVDGGNGNAPYAAFQLPTFATPITLPVGQIQNVALKTADVCAIFSGTETQVGKTTTITQVVVRADSSGTSFIFSDWLNQNCGGNNGPFSSANGFPSTKPNWSAAFQAAGGNTALLNAQTGSGGVAGQISATKGAIGYVSPDYVQPIVNNGAYPATVNKQAPTVANVTKHLAKTKYPTSYNTATIGQVINDSLVASTNAGGYPIVGFTFIDTYQCYNASVAGGNIGDDNQGSELRGALNYFYGVGATTGQKADIAALLNNQGFVAPTASIIKLLSGTNGPLNSKTGIQNKSCP